MDFRTWISQNGDSRYLGFTGNDGQIDTTKGGYDTSLRSYENNETNRNLLQGKVNQYWDAYQSQNKGLLGAATSAGSGVSGGAAGAPDTTAADLAYLDDQEGVLRGMLGSAANTLNNGLTQINDSHAKEVGRTEAQKTAAGQQFNTKREDTNRDKSGALGRVNSGARTLSESVRRMLGMAGGTNSTAFNEAAPEMIGRDTTMKRTGVLETSGRNLRDIDSAETSTMDRFKQYVEDLNEQKKQKESGLREGVLGQEQQINQSLGQIARDKVAARGGDYGEMRRASAPYQAEAAARAAALDGLFERFRTPYQTKDVAVDAPELTDYTVDRTAITPNQSNGAGGSPYQQFLKKKFSESTI